MVTLRILMVLFLCAQSACCVASCRFMDSGDDFIERDNIIRFRQGFKPTASKKAVKKNVEPFVLKDLPFDTLPVKTPSGEVFYYGYGEDRTKPLTRIQNLSQKYHVEVYLYSVTYGKMECRVSWLSKNEMVSFSMSYFLRFPHLLKALLKSPMVEEKSCGKTTRKMFYSLYETVLPDDYQISQEGFGEYSSFDELPMNIRGPIIDRFNYQTIGVFRHDINGVFT